MNTVELHDDSQIQYHGDASLVLNILGRVY